MRVFIISILMFLVIISGIIINSIYLTNLTTEMLDLVENIPESMDDLMTLWEKNYSFVSITVNYSYIYTITTSLISTQRLYENNCEGEFEAARDILHEEIMKLHELEMFSIDNII